MIKKQIDQIVNFLSAYPRPVAEAGIEAWRKYDPPPQGQDIEGMATTVPLAQSYSDLDPDAKQLVSEESAHKLFLPICKCGRQLNLAGVCPGCAKGKEGLKSKLFCSSCGHEAYFKETVPEKLHQLRTMNKIGPDYVK